MNVYNGLFWFIFPASLVIVNDTSAYIFGVFFGKTPLIKLSPKKTWEGFIGALGATLVFAYFASKVLSNFDYMMCPQKEIKIRPFESLTCEKSPFLRDHIEMPDMFHYIGLYQIGISPIQLTALIFAVFTSLVAPFGGFFASGFKRAFKIKDFGDSIPGHGGITDRMDCQLLTGMFVYVWTSQLIFNRTPTIENILVQISKLAQVDKLLLFDRVKKLIQK